MSEQVNYQELEQLVNDQPRVHGTTIYQDARPRTQKIYDQTIQMGWDILADRNAAQPSPQTMVDMAVQSINTAIKALKSNPVLSASPTKFPKPNSTRSEVRPSQVTAQPAVSRQPSSVPSSPASTSSQPTQSVAEENSQPTADANTNAVADPASTAAPTTPQSTAAPSQPSIAQPTEVTQPTADEGTNSGQPSARSTAASSVSAGPAASDSATSQETSAATTSTASQKVTATASTAVETTAAEKSSGKSDAAMSLATAATTQTTNAEQGDPAAKKKHNLPMVVRQKTNWHLLPQAIWRGLRWTLGSRKVLK